VPAESFLSGKEAVTEAASFNPGGRKRYAEAIGGPPGLVGQPISFGGKSESGLE